MDLSLFTCLTIMTVVIIVVMLVLLVSRSLQWPANIPPGPSGYPIIGSMLLLRKGNVLEIFQKLRTQYGDVFSIRIGVNLTVVISGVESLKEAFIKHAEEFSDRQSDYASRLILQDKGIVFSIGEHWKRTRSFSLSTLKSFGFGKKSLESRVHEEIIAFLDIIDKQNGQPFNMKELTVLGVSNIICNITFGKRFDYTDSRFKKLTSLLAENSRLNSVGGTTRSLPGLRFLPGYMFNIKRVINILKDIKGFVDEQIDDHRKTLDINNPRDFIDAFLSEQKKCNTDDPLFEDINIAASVINLFVAGTHTTATAFHWAVVYLIHNRPIQEKLRREIETVVGTSRLPSLEDKPSMPYYEAFITEVLRMGNVAPLSGPHGATKDIYFRGMTIPKGSIILPNLNSVLTDPDLFENPDKFNPERFLGKDGQLNGKQRTVLAFSLGRRICLGESMARMELFLFMTSLLQRFEFLPALPDELPSLDPILGLAREPRDFECRLVKFK